MDGAAGPEVQAFLHKHELETQRQLPSWEETLKSDVRKESAAEIAALTSQVAKLQAENAALRSATTAAQKVSEDLQVRSSQTSCAHGQRSLLCVHRAGSPWLRALLRREGAHARSSGSNSGVRRLPSPIGCLIGARRGGMTTPALASF